MKKAALLSFLAILAATNAQAVEPPPWNPSPPYNWQGVFVGVNAGGGWGNDSSSESVTDGGPTGTSAGFRQNGGLAGFQAGYNVPLGQNIIFGADADWDTYNVEGGYRQLSSGNGDDVKYDWIASLRARLGVPFGMVLPYVDGGFAFGDVKDTFIAGNSAAQAMSDIRFGWTAGAGVEVGLPENFAARLDYRYTEFASYNQSPSAVLPGLTYRQTPRVNTVTAGISYYFK